MTSQDDHRFDRRRFLRGCARGGLLGALTALGAVLTWRGQTCSRGGTCGGCQVYGRCDLPQAAEYERHQKGRST